MPSTIMPREKELDTPEKRQKHVVAVVGCGRMGLPTACLFAEAGFNVVCLDTNPVLVSHINKGIIPFQEPELDTLLKRNLKERRIAATTDAKEAISRGDIIIVVVDTPIDKKKRPDYSRLEEACKNIGLNLKPGALVIMASTVGPGLTETLVKETLEMTSGQKAGVDFGLAYSPVRATVGRVLQNMTNYTRVVGALEKTSLSAAKAVLKTVVRGEVLDVSNIKTAEAVKLFENIYRDVNLALANEFAGFCEKLGIDYLEAQAAADTQPYCHLLQPGLVSGHIPKDPYLLIEEAESLSVRLQMTALARKINDNTVKHALRLVRNALSSCGKTASRARVAVLGVSYRPNVKETKGTLVSELVSLLKKKGAKVSVFDPFFSFSELKSLGFPAERTITRTIEGADCLVIAVGHDRFKRLRFGRIKVLMRKPAAIVDLAGVASPQDLEKEDFVYRGFGRGVWTK